MSRQYRQYTEADKATALALLQANNNNLKQTARELSIPRATLAKWTKGEGVNSAVIQKCDEKKEELGDLFEKAARLYLGRSLEPDVIAKTNGKDAMVTAATATDKMQLMRNKPTSINQNNSQEMLIMNCLRTIKDLIEREKLAVQQAIFEYFTEIRPEYAELREVVEQKLLSESVSE